MAKKHFTRPAYPATRRVTAAGISVGDFVIVGEALKGFALEDTVASGDLAGTVLIGFGEVESVYLQAEATSGGIVEGDYLKWDATLDGGAGGFTDLGASSSDFDAIAGAIADIAQGNNALGEVLIPAPY